MIHNSKLEAFTRAKMAINPIDFRFSAEFFRHVPDTPGVYWMQDSRRNILYVAASRKLRTDLLHFKQIKLQDAPDYLQDLAPLVKQIDWKTAESFQKAQNMSKVLIKQCRPPFNKRQKEALPHFIEVKLKGPSKLTILWGDTPSEKNLGYTTFGPFFGKNSLHRTYSALIRWIWIVGNKADAENIPPHLMKPLLKNGFEVPITQLFFENQRWINSLSRFLNANSDLFLDFGLRKIENIKINSMTHLQSELFHEDLVALERFFKRYCKVQIRIIPSITQ